ncbi:kinesin-like protein Klp61F isoform X2 [Venturia canescens]|uniref:kinesin-like protein Klp61F isoform X2 n=1 Tax=Venturia canescens TaxID=32260 RepID=UPI001C9C0850|nr:kinesin-like protein Klp61F isoform X2 [Venturia canescens]
MNETRSSKKDKNQHIQVFARVRPINNTEKIGKSATVVDVTSCKEVVVRERPQDKLTKKFTFDRVFGPSSKQIDVYNAVVSPLLDEVLAGYNCTVFAYGQTGTGKTFTMEGCSNDPALHWQSDTQAGIIPRSLSHLFDELRTLDAQEYSVRVSFLELYNEELFDLLSPTDDASKIRLYEDASRKGAVIIHGLEEVTVHNKTEVYKILEKGSEKRQTAATLMNAQSSRSHTVFSITVHIKENTVDGEELLKTGKLNLVDLAGSENVGRSGAVDRRAREAGNINQSLLTLGRVITALVERAPHIPYRESKLTRLLQESLGGRTKTSIIATISPASVNLEETLSTLDYAYRAKNITNRPEINQKLSKKALLKEYTEEIERLRRDLLATRERNGVYLAQENYNEMQSTIEVLGKEIEEKINHIKALEDIMVNKAKLFSDLETELEQKTNTLYETKDQLETTKTVLLSTKNDLLTTQYDRDIQKHLVEKHVNTEKILYSQAKTLLKVADIATDDTYKLHDKIFRKKRVEEENENLGQQFRKNISDSFENIEQDLSIYTRDLVQFCLSMKDQLHAQVAANSRGIDSTIELSKNLVKEERSIAEDLESRVNESYDEYKKLIEEHVNAASGMTKEQISILRNNALNLAPRIRELCENKIAENLRLVNEQNAKKFECLLTYVKDSTDTLCEKLLTDRDRLAASIKEIRRSVETSKDDQQNLLKSQNEFSKAFEGLWNHYKTLKTQQEDNYAAITHSLDQTTAVCDDICKRSTDICDNQVKFQRKFEKEIHGSVGAIREIIASNLDKNSGIALESIEKSRALVKDLETGIDVNCEALDKYQFVVENNAQKMQKRTEEDRTSLLANTNKLRKIVSDASVTHIEMSEKQRSNMTNSSTEICRKFEDQGVKSTEWNNRITAELHTTKHQVDKFLIEDLRRDMPTGCTPAKREFQYPRNLVTTSPHERIIRRFREMRKQSEESEDEDSTIVSGDSTLKIQSGSPNRKSSTPSSAIKDRKTSTPNDRYADCNDSVNPLIKSASTSDLSFIAKRPSFDTSVHSESEIYTKNNNKENGNEDFAKPEKRIPVKRSSKTKTNSRRVLGSYN